MEGDTKDYDTDDILSSSLDLIEERSQCNIPLQSRPRYAVETETITDVSSEDDYPLTQSRFKNDSAEESSNESLPKDVLASLLEKNDNVTDSQVAAVEKAVDLSDMLDVGGPCQVGKNITRPKQDKRFSSVTPETYLKQLRPRVPTNTLRKNKWAVESFNKWMDETLNADRSEQVPGVVEALQKYNDICDIDDANLNLVVSVFILALKKRDGGEYKGSSLFQLVCALQRHLEVNGRRVSFLADPKFDAIKTALDNSMQQACRRGIGLTKKRAEVIPIDKEETLWRNSILGDDTPDKLSRTVFWIIGVQFGLRGGEEHRDLNFNNFAVKTDSDGKRFLEYTECVSKTYRGGIKHRKIEPHTARAYENMKEPEKCPVKLFLKYADKLHPMANKDTTFYFKPVKVVKNESVWYTLLPLGHNTLRVMVKTIMNAGGFTGCYTNHSLRATTATRLFNAGIPEQLIRAQTGHRSDAIFDYKRPSNDQLCEVSRALHSGSKSADPATDSKAEVATDVPSIVDMNSVYPTINFCGNTTVIFNLQK